jgi:hypothetical protein
MGNNFACEGTKITQPNKHLGFIIRVIHGDKVPYKYTKEISLQVLLYQVGTERGTN